MKNFTAIKKQDADIFSDIRIDFEKYRKENPKAKLPEFSNSIGSSLLFLSIWIRSVKGTNKKAIEAGKEYSKLRKFIDKPVIKITIQGKEKGVLFNVKNEYLIEEILIRIRSLEIIREVTPKSVKPKELLSRLMEMPAFKNISELKTNGVCDAFIVHYINNVSIFSIELENDLIDASILPRPRNISGFTLAEIEQTAQEERQLLKKIQGERKQSILIPSIEAFQKAFNRTKALRT